MHKNFIKLKTNETVGLNFRPFITPDMESTWTGHAIRLGSKLQGNGGGFI
jgi:hypothetical protein